MNTPQTTDCHFVREHLSAYMDGETVDAVALQIEQHLSNCPACAAEHSEFQKVGDLFQSSAMRDTVGAADARLPTWESLERRMSDRNQNHSSQVQRSAVPSARNWKVLAAVVVAVAASLLIFIGLRLPWGRSVVVEQPSQLASINLQPVLELFETNPDTALQQLTGHFTSIQALALAELDTGLGRATYASAAAEQNRLPGGAKLTHATLISFPFCKCPEGQCSCGPSGCKCVACVCQRPDGSSYLVLEHCKSQDVSFGDLPMKLVTRDGHAVQQVTVNGTQMLSFDRPTGRVTVVGLRSDAEIDTLLASR